MPRSRSYQSKLLEDLKDPGEAAEYLNAAIEEGDRELFLLALRNVAEAHGGLTRVAELTHLNRENLYRMLSERGNPEFSSLFSLLDALGFRLAVELKQYQAERSSSPNEGADILILSPRRVPAAPVGKRLTLAAKTEREVPERIIAVTPDGEEVGSLEYDFQNGQLYLEVKGNIPTWHNIAVEVETKDGEKFRALTARESERKLILLRGVLLKRDKVERITLSPHRDRSKK